MYYCRATFVKRNQVFFSLFLLALHVSSQTAVKTRLHAVHGSSEYKTTSVQVYKCVAPKHVFILF